MRTNRTIIYFQFNLVQFLQTGNQVSWKPVEKEPRFDMMGLVMNFIGPGILVIPSVSFLLVFIDIDCAYHVIPLQFGRSVLDLALRSCVTLLTLIEVGTTLGLIHLIIITLVMHTKSIYIHLQYNLVSGVPGIGNLVVTLHSGTLNLNNNVDFSC